MKRNVKDSGAKPIIPEVKASDEDACNYSDHAMYVIDEMKGIINNTIDGLHIDPQSPFLHDRLLKYSTVYFRNMKILGLLKAKAKDPKATLRDKYVLPAQPLLDPQGIYPMGNVSSTGVISLIRKGKDAKRK